MNNRMYISGAISGRPHYEVQKQFAEAETKVKQWQYEPVNPINNGVPTDSPWHTHMMADLAMLLTCGAIFMLEGWEKSDGANIEHLFAQKMQIPIIYEQQKIRFRYPVIEEEIR